MKHYRLRMVYLGRVIQEAVVEAESAQEAWRMAHPAQADPALLAGVGKAAAWAEVAEVMEDAA